MTDLAAWHHAIRSAFESDGRPVVGSPSVSAPEGAGVVVVPLDEDATATAIQVVTALDPRVVILEVPDDEAEEFGAHLAGASWVQLLFVTTDALARFEDTDADDTRAEFTEDDRAVVVAAVEDLVRETPLSSHGGLREARALLLGYLGERQPQVAAVLSEAGFVTGEFASMLHDGLRDSHAMLLRSDVADLAGRILAEEDLTPAMSRTLIRDRVYTRLKRQDPTCVTKSAVEGVVFEVASLLSEVVPGATAAARGVRVNPEQGALLDI
ncbi:hypothetical protein CHO01_27440 [Cellulomonas hominis]|uniref:Uncharacterized protein n=1 Tax=Cellulomonas hominis TaxID=156981 RepID=A0A511FIH8_9CELL|nr:hypothetical protein [Cellulomonas hominis]MBB5472855.1 hypothetical protein [Cellulomonas hominis]NKY05780.1 hypothetical protein [Cellulomonas hominis]GEL47628.1 hypothetical protein CHO01_27440 [Cellulomonas hominis]